MFLQCNQTQIFNDGLEHTVGVKSMSPVDIELLFVISYNINALHDNIY